MIAAVDSDQIYEMLKKIQSDMSLLKEGQRDLRQDNFSLRNQMHTMQGDLNSLRGSIGHIEDRLNRIENRLDLREFPKATQRPFDPSD